jgi:aromatic-L-amino-acid decarboxylase
VYLALFGSIVGFTSYVYALKHAPATIVGTYAYVNPVIAVLLGWWILHETVTGRTFVAMGLILGAVVWIQFSDVLKRRAVGRSDGRTENPHASHPSARPTARPFRVRHMSDLTLDPQNWDELRALGHRMLDDTFEFLRTVRERPVWRPVPPEVRAELDEPIPYEGSDPAEVYEMFRRDIQPYPTGNIHPRYWGWVKGTGTPLGVLSEMLAAGMNAHLAGFDQSASLVEAKVITWLAELLGYPKGASGLLVSGGSMANFVGLAVARQARAGFDVRTEGLQGDHPLLTVYCSTETHSSIQRAVELLGLGSRALRRIPVDPAYRIDIDALRTTIAHDRAAGMRPIAVVGNAGTVNTGATDNLEALATLARAEGIWLHVDGAFGALAALSPSLRPVVVGLDRADSIAFDLHKWGYLPFEVGCTLVRDARAHHAAFAVTATYLSSLERGPAAAGMPWADLGIQLTRGFRALKVWMAFKSHGVRRIAELIEQNVAQAQYLADLVERDPHLELVAPVPLNVVCFRFAAPDLDDDRLNTLNQEILIRIQERGVALPSHTVLNGRFAIRCAIVNHRTRREDLELLARAVVDTGTAMLGQLTYQGAKV